MSLIQKFHEGGVFMYFILALGVLTVGLIVERISALYLKVKSAPADFRQQLLTYISRGDLRGAETYAKGFSTETSLGRVVETGCHLRANGGGEEELQARMDEKLSSEISKLDRRTGFLGMFGNVATLLGLLGTISGMIRSFAAVANANPADRATLLSSGIAEAMNCTAFGLIVAIPALVAYAVFQNKTDRMVTALTETTTQIYNDLLFLVEGSTKSARETTGRNTGVGTPAPTLSV